MLTISLQHKYFNMQRSTISNNQRNTNIVSKVSCTHALEELFVATIYIKKKWLKEKNNGTILWNSFTKQSSRDAALVCNTP